MLMVHGFHHVAIQARDVEGLSRFYREVLGLTELRRWFQDDSKERLRSIWLACGGGFVAIEQAGVGPLPLEKEFRSPLPGLHVLALGIRLIERSSVEAQLEAAGVVIEHRTKWSLFIRDPEGNRLGLTHYPEEPPHVSART